LEDARHNVDCQRRAELDAAHCSFTPVAAVDEIEDEDGRKTTGDVISDVTEIRIARPPDAADGIDANWSGGGVFEDEACVR
jgi:hypothetical protein